MCSTVAAGSSCEVLLQVIPVRVISKSGNQITTFGLLDSGSDITMTDLSLVKLLNIKGSPSKLSLTTVNNADAEEESLRVDFQTAPVDSGNDHLIDVKSAWAVKDLTIPLKHTKVTRSVGQWSHLQQVPFPEVERSKISILLGTNIQEVFIPLEVKRGKPNEPIAIKSCIGWSILGGCPSVPSSTPVQVNLINGEDVTLSDQLEEFWRVESYGTSKCETKPLSVEDQRAMNLISNSICKHDGHYEMGLLWKSDNPVLPYNRTLAEARLQHLKRRFLRDPELEVKYRAVIEDCVTKGYARMLTKEEAATVSKTTWFLPHHPVSNPNKPGKVRVMFDVAARFSGTSLNEQLLQGPSLTNDLSGVLIRFREEEIAFSTDIEGMFYQTRVTPSDTDSLRFLWWPKGIDVPPEKYKMLVHIFGAKSSPCCANKALSMTAQDKENYPPKVIRTVCRNFYVNDVLKSVPNTDQAIPLASDLMKLLREGGFHLTKFASNSRELLASIPPASRANPKLDLDLDQLPLERALGVYWDAQSDTFNIVSSLFNPLGFLSPFVFTAKILLQELWRQKLSWDQEVPEPYSSLWQKWLQELPYVTTIEIPRCYKTQCLSAQATVQLHNFSDASRHGYAVSYLWFIHEQGVIHCSFVMGKTRNAPIKERTIPRLELQATVLAVGLSNSILKELDLQVDGTFSWSDLMTSLQFIKNQTTRFQTFVANRVAEIHESTTSEQWHHVPGSMNPADEGSRGVTIQHFQPGCQWWSGPCFLWQPEHQWPNAQVEDVRSDDKKI